MADRSALPFVALGLTVLGLSLACGRADGSGEPADVDPPVTKEATASFAPQGRSFLEEAPAPLEPTVTTVDTRLATGAIDAGALRSSGPARPTGLGAFAQSVDPSRLTPEALARNPLVIGASKREPFVLPEGADPLDPKVYGWEKDDEGHWIISWADLSLEGIDSDLLLDALVYPEEYEEDELVFPERIRALDGERISLTGYMIAVVWDDAKVTNFMLVRDLMACCFGGSPEPDEWVDVTMVDEGSHYIQYVPVVTRGTFHIQGISDPAGYATGAFRIDGLDTREE